MVLVTSTSGIHALTLFPHFPFRSVPPPARLACLYPGVRPVLTTTLSGKRFCWRDGQWHAAKETDDAPVS
jgi:hypothetical protein